jgi:hypothetical protein
MSGIAGCDPEHLASSIGNAMRELRRRPRDLWIDLVRADQTDRWRRVSGITAEEYFGIFQSFWRRPKMRWL